MEKKITIKHFLNKRVKPKQAIVAGFFPVYTQLIYDRKTTAINFLREINKKGLSNFEFEEIIKKKSGEIYSRFSEVELQVEMMIRHEANLMGNKFTLTGFSQRYNRYLSAISNTLNIVIVARFGKLLEACLTVREHKSLNGLKRSCNYTSLAGCEFTQVYEEVKKKHIPDIRKKLTGDIEILITIYIQFLHFENVRGKFDKNQVYRIPAKYIFTDWLSGNIREDFVNFLTQKCNEAKIGYHETKDAQNDQRVKKLLLDFQPEHSSLLQYNDAIEKLVLSSGDAF